MSLKASQGAVSCVTVYTPSPDGDERKYARLAATAAGRTLLECPVDPAQVDVRRSRQGRLARPGAHAHLWPIEQAFFETARELNVGAFVSGLGGDNVLCALSSAGPAADALLAFGPGRRFWRSVEDLSKLHNCTAWTAARLAVRKAFRKPRPFSADLSFLAPDVATQGAPAHPWWPPPDGMAPGKVDHVRSLMLAQAYLDRYAHAAQAPILYPLLAQPIVEACLGIPTWAWIEGGFDRAVARRAFADLLPPEIRRRRTKGSLDAYVAAAFTTNRRRLREHLLEGRLRGEDLLDRPRIETALAASYRASSEEMFRLLQLADVEAWTRTWDG